MSRPSEYADGATGGAPQRPPNVYLPQAEPPPAYDAYADPAAAHGWQDAYDPADAQGARDDTQDAARGPGDTRRLPPVPVPSHGRAGAGRHSRRRRAPWRGRRVAVAAGAVGAVSAAALLAGLGFPDAPSGGRPGGGGRTGPTAGESPTAPQAGSGRTPAPANPLDGGAANSDEPSGPATASPSTETSATPAESGQNAPSSTAAGPTAASPTAGTPTTSPPAAEATPPGRAGGKPGYGPGGTKGPK
ncbi:hypothetical protein [Streptomyces sp. NPDC007991]|uniref:hypothetical protein n=1 Tax=Streptomyces sp. NPDC007991 TaxID=3364803 RepID=UPI0036E70284